ncbi:MAG TPA: YbaK/EbsC family protein [Gaiellaceae bacterium]|nr:YbaK/EbsC family protein [Gaiellaceae bacterium]
MEGAGTAQAWPEPVERVGDALEAAGAEARIEEFAQTAATAADASRAIGCELRQIVKSLLFVCDGQPVLVLVPGDRRADARKIAAAAGARRAKVAGPEQVEEATGYAPGAVSPFGLRSVERVLVDRSLLAASLVWVGAGSHRHLAGLAPVELVRVSRAQAVDVAADT